MIAIQVVPPELRFKSIFEMPEKEILNEIVQLNSVSERLESLADRHPVAGEALLSIAVRIRNSAVLLEVLRKGRFES